AQAGPAPARPDLIERAHVDTAAKRALSGKDEDPRGRVAVDLGQRGDELGRCVHCERVSHLGSPQCDGSDLTVPLERYQGHEITSERVRGIGFSQSASRATSTQPMPIRSGREIASPRWATPVAIPISGITSMFMLATLAGMRFRRKAQSGHPSAVTITLYARLSANT